MVNTKRAAKQFARGQRGGILTTVIPASATTASKAVVNCPARSRTRNRKLAVRSPRFSVRLRVCLGGPAPVGISGHSQDVQLAVADLEC
jgi:hypothetical protein